MYEDISTKQVEVLNFIRNQVNKKGYPPSVREICKGLNIKSTSTVHGYLEVLEKKGYIRKDHAKTRAIEVLDKIGDDFISYKKEVVNIPIIGRVTAGAPVLAIENIEDVFPMPVDFVPSGESFMLRVKGNSMINAGIHDKDFILIKQQSTAENGDIIVALINNEATVKRFFKEKEHIRLQPENDEMEPIISKDVKVVGKVVGLYRKV